MSFGLTSNRGLGNSDIAQYRPTQAGRSYVASIALRARQRRRRLEESLWPWLGVVTGEWWSRSSVRVKQTVKKSVREVVSEEV